MSREMKDLTKLRKESEGKRIKMKKIILMLIMLISVLLAVPAFATTQSLGWWQEGAPGTTHERWDFTPASQNPLNPIQFYPEEEYNPNDNGTPGSQVFAQTLIGTYETNADNKGYLTGNTIIVDLKVSDYLNDNNHKEVWVDLGLTSGSMISATLAATGNHGYNYAVTLLPGPGPGTGADFGFLVQPNPYYEDMLISITGSANGAPAVLNYINVDTICIPEPVTICLLGLGALGLLKRRKA